MSQVELSVASQLSKVVADLEKIAKASTKVEDGLKQSGQAVDEAMANGTKKTERKLNDVRSLSSRLAQQILGDFKALASLNAIEGSLKLSSQFKGVLTETVTLSDAIRKLGTTFGISSANFSSFQTKLTKGLGDVGLSSQVATDALQALVDTPVRGQEAILAYSKSAGELASLTNSKGQEGGVAKGMAEVIRAQGGNPNDVKQMTKVAEDLRRVFNQTGQGPVQTLKSMQDLFTNMPKDLRGKITTRGLSNLAATEQVAGPGSTKFLEELLGKSPIARTALKAQGFGNVVGDQGLNVDAFKKASKSILGRIGMDPEMAAQTLGISEEAAKGFIRLADSLDKVKAAQDGIAKQTGNVESQYKSSMGAGEAFRASINRVKATVAGPLSAATQKGTDLLSKASETTLGSAGVVAGGGLLAALLAGGGLKGLGGGMLGGLGKAAAVQGITGKEVQPVYVVNASEMGGGAGIGGALGGMGGMLGKAGLIGSVAAAGVGAGLGLENLYEKGVGSNLGKDTLGAGMGDLDKMIQSAFTGIFMKMSGMQNIQKVQVELNEKQLKKAKPLTRGATY